MTIAWVTTRPCLRTLPHSRSTHSPVLRAYVRLYMTCAPPGPSPRVSAIIRAPRLLPRAPTRIHACPSPSRRPRLRSSTTRHTDVTTRLARPSRVAPRHLPTVLSSQATDRRARTVPTSLPCPRTIFFFFFFFFKSFYRPTGLAYDGRYTGNTGGHLRPHSPAADCNNDGPLKVAPHCSDAIPAPFTSLP